LEKGPEVWNNAYNIAVDESVTLASILERMSKAMGLPLTEKDFEQEGDFYLYPTVYAGPMSIQVMISIHTTPILKYNVVSK
jgi:hypothetical protein